jgi:hypothetical protein
MKYKKSTLAARKISSLTEKTGKVQSLLIIRQFSNF